MQGEFEPRELRRGRAVVAIVRLVLEPVLGQVPASNGPAGEADLWTDVGLLGVRNVDQLVARPRRVLDLDGQRVLVEWVVRQLERLEKLSLDVELLQLLA